jgi:hypothetical protein
MGLRSYDLNSNFIFRLELRHGLPIAYCPLPIDLRGC